MRSFFFSRRSAVIRDRAVWRFRHGQWFRCGRFGCPVGGLLCGIGGSEKRAAFGIGRRVTLHRVIGVGYSDSTPGVTLNYDQSSVLGVSLSNTKGRLSHAVAGTSTAGSIMSYVVHPFKLDTRGQV